MSDELSKILVVEDELIIAKDIESKLKSMGYDVKRLSSGEDAVNYCEDTTPDLILMDISLRDDMTGIEASAIIKKKYNIPIIYLTSYSDKKTFTEAMNTEPVNYLIKPFDVHELKTAIEMCLFQQ